MKNLIILILLGIMISISSCTYRTTELYSVCTCEAREKMSDFISKNMRSANNMSDEEMEDVIKELKNTAIVLFCDQKNLPAVNKGGHISLLAEEVELDSCEFIIE